MAEVVHVLNEDVSPAEANVWTMICGAQCVVFDDGETVPQMDFVLPMDAIEASCEACRKGGERTTVAAEELIITTRGNGR